MSLTSEAQALELAKQAMAGRDFETVDRVIAAAQQAFETTRNGGWLDVINRILRVCPTE